MLMVSATAARVRNEDLEDDGAHGRPLQQMGCLCVPRGYFAVHPDDHVSNIEGAILGGHAARMN
jgi:hypothetical protein